MKQTFGQYCPLNAIRQKIGQHFPLQQSNQKSGSISPSTTRGFYRVTRVDVCDLRARPVLSHAGAKTSASGRNTNGQTRAAVRTIPRKDPKTGDSRQQPPSESHRQGHLRHKYCTRAQKGGNNRQPSSFKPQTGPTPTQQNHMQLLQNKRKNWAAFPP